MVVGNCNIRHVWMHECQQFYVVLNSRRQHTKHGNSNAELGSTGFLAPAGLGQSPFSIPSQKSKGCHLYF